VEVLLTWLNWFRDYQSVRELVRLSLININPVGILASATISCMTPEKLITRALLEGACADLVSTSWSHIAVVDSIVLQAAC